MNRKKIYIMNSWVRKTALTISVVLFSFSAFCQSAIKVACIGNSVTFGFGQKYPHQTSYPAVLQNKLGLRYTVRNFGHSGATLLRQGHNPYFKTPEYKEVISYAPDIAVLDLGLNDTDPRNWPDYREEFAADYSWIIETLRKTNPNMQIFICRLTPVFADHPRFQSGTRDWFW